MKTSMLGRAQRVALAARWPEVVTRGVRDEEDVSLFPGDLVKLPASVRWGDGADWDVCGTVLGYALDKLGAPSVVVHAPAWARGRMDSWRTWIFNGDFCRRISEAEAERVVAIAAIHAGAVAGQVVDADVRVAISQSWMQVMLGGVSTKGGVPIRPGDLVRLPRNVARNRGSQLHAAGLCLGYAVGLDGSPCVVADAVGEDVPTLTRWRTWLVRGKEVIVISSKEAWRLESRYDTNGRLKQGKSFSV